MSFVSPPLQTEKKKKWTSSSSSSCAPDHHGSVFLQGRHKYDEHTLTHTLILHAGTCTHFHVLCTFVHFYSKRLTKEAENNENIK